MHHPESISQRTGDMTAVMRAVPRPSGQRVLRIGLVQGGKVIEERIIDARAPVTIGSNERNSFVLAADSVTSAAFPSAMPSTFALFETVGNAYHLNAIDGMTGRLSLKGAVTDLGLQLAETRPTRRGALTLRPIALGDEARGKVTVGESTFLFELVAPRPSKPRPQLPVSVKGGLDIDWTTTMIAALSFLFHFGIVGSIYSDWMDPVVDDDLHVAQLIESVKQLPAPPVVEDQKERVNAGATAATPAPAPAAPNRANPASQAKPGVTERMADRKASQIANELQSLDVAMMAALDGNGASTDRVLGSSDMPLALLDQAAASNAAASIGNSDGLRLGGVAFNGRPGEVGANGLQALAHDGKGEPAASGGQALQKPGPKGGNVSVGAGTPRGGHVANAEAVVARMAAGFRRCYNQGLIDNPDMAGSVRITAKIGPNGEVIGVSPSPGGGNLSGKVIGCVAARVASSQFSPPDDGGATLDIPVSFKTQ